jgi:hypothetical protein
MGVCHCMGLDTITSKRQKQSKQNNKLNKPTVIPIKNAKHKDTDTTFSCKQTKIEHIRYIYI